MGYPSNQGVTPNPLAPTQPATPSTPAVKKPLARVQSNYGTAITDGFKKVGNDLVTNQLPNVIHRILHGIVDALLPGGPYTPYIGRGYGPSVGYLGYQNPAPSLRMSSYPTGLRANVPGYLPQQEEPVMSRRRQFDTFILPNKATAMEIFQGLMADSTAAGYLTVSQVYERLGIACPSFMGVSYYWTPEDIAAADIIETASGECRVKMPKAQLLAR